MADSTNREEQVESLLRRALDGLPRRRAPTSLEVRIHAELQRRAALPRWHRGFGQWSALPRSLFLAACAGLMAQTIRGGGWPVETAQWAGDLAVLALAWAHPLLAILAEAGDTAGRLVGANPPAWFSLALSVGAMFYVILFGLGAAAYRMLYLKPSRQQVIRS